MLSPGFPLCAGARTGSVAGSRSWQEEPETLAGPSPRRGADRAGNRLLAAFPDPEAGEKVSRPRSLETSPSPGARWIGWAWLTAQLEERREPSGSGSGARLRVPSCGFPVEPWALMPAARVGGTVGGCARGPGPGSCFLVRSATNQGHSQPAGCPSPGACGPFVHLLCPSLPLTPPRGRTSPPTAVAEPPATGSLAWVQGTAHLALGCTAFVRLHGP